MALPPRLCLAALDCASASVRASAISCYSRRVGRSLSPARPRMKLRLSTAATPTATPGPDSGPVAVRMPPAPSSLWLADLRARVGKCIGFGCSTAQVAQASAVLRALATEWRGLMAGNEGFLTGGRRGLSDQKVVWGEMDSFVRDGRGRVGPRLRCYLLSEKVLGN